MMVKTGSATTGQELGYFNASVPEAGAEVTDFAAVTAGLPDDVLRRPRRLAYHEIWVFTAGAGLAMIDFEFITCEPGTVLHVRPGQVRQAPSPVDGAGVEATIVLFAEEFPAHTTDVLSYLRAGPNAIHTGLPVALRSSMQEVRRAYSEPHSDRRARDVLKLLLAVFVLRLAQYTPADASDERDLYERFTAELERSFATIRSADVYASRLGYTAKTLTRACRIATGKTAKRLIDERVALEAKRLLADTRLTAAQIGTRLGFSEPTNFAKFFARVVGSTTREFRRRYRL
jgi:AraC-like DNA-binding protein